MKGLPARFASCIGITVVFLTIFDESIFAQTCAPGQLRVTIVDSLQNPAVEVKVRVGTDSVTIAETVTHTGEAAFENVPCGSWNISATKEGFEVTNATVQIKDGEPASAVLTLRPKIQHSSVEVKETAPAVEQGSSVKTTLRPSEVKHLPGNPATVSDTLPLVPGVVRMFNGELKIDGTGEQRSALVVNQTDVTDPATGMFGQTIPVDSVETVNVLKTPFLAQYGRFTSGVVAVETRRGGDKWHAELNEPFPDFRIRSWHMRGIRNMTPRFFVGGPVVHNRVYLNTAVQYFWQRDSNRTLPFPYNESKRQWINSFTQLDFIVSPKRFVTATAHLSPQHTNFVNPEYFNPQPVTPSYAQHNYVGTLADHWSIFGGELDSSVSIQRFDAFVGAQGDSEMVLTPLGNSGNYFGTQNRDARRTEWLETFSFAPIRVAGTQFVKIGSSLTGSSDDGQFTYRPANIVDSAGGLLERIDFTKRNPFSRSDLESTVFAQNHWALNSKLAFDYGWRLEHQRLAESVRMAPRSGLAWMPFSNERTVFRAGYGQFYDHIPLNVYAFSHYPERTVTFYAPDGSIVGSPMHFVNVIGNVAGPRSFLVHGERVAGGFAPRGATWNLQAEHTFSRLLRVRGVYTDSRSVGLIVFQPDALGSVPEVVLNGNGRSRYRQAEAMARFAWKKGQQLFFSYTRSRAQGNLNGFDTFLGNFPSPLLHRDVYSNLPADLPNRFLMWGRVMVHRLGVQVLPIVEYRNGFPYARYDERQDYVGVPNSDSSRFPNFFSADARIMKDVKVNPKYTLRFSVTGFNLSNHFNALSVHANIADPQYGVFFGNYHRRYRFDFDVVF